MVVSDLIRAVMDRSTRRPVRVYPKGRCWCGSGLQGLLSMIFLDGSLGQFIDPNGAVWASSFVRSHWLGGVAEWFL